MTTYLLPQKALPICMYQDVTVQPKLGTLYKPPLRYDKVGIFGVIQ